MNSLIADGEILPGTRYVPFRCEDSVVLAQKMWFGYGGIPLFSENIASVIQQLKILKKPVPPLFTDENEFFRITKRLLNRMKYFRSGIITLNIFAGNTETHFLVNAVPGEEFDFPISKKGLQVNHAEMIKFSKNAVSKFAFFNEPIWNIAGATLAGTPFANAIFVNENGAVTDCIGANIFAVKGRRLFTPATETGCYTDTLRKYILEATAACSLKIDEISTLTKEELLEMNEVFIASEAKGIEWIMGIQNKRFVHQYSGDIQLKINEILKIKIV